MTKLLDIVERFSSRASARRLLMTIITVMVGMSVWGETVTLTCFDGTEVIENVGRYISNGEFVFSCESAANNDVTHNPPVTFKLSLIGGGSISNSSNDLYLGNGSKGGNKSANFSWEVPDGYSIKVVRLLINTRVYTSTDAMCNLNSIATGSIGTKVSDVFGSNTAVTLLDGNGITNGVLISYYYPNSTSWVGDRETYIDRIEVSYTLTHTESKDFRHLDGDNWTYGHYQFEDNSIEDNGSSTRLGNAQTKIEARDCYSKVLIKDVDNRKEVNRSFIAHYQGIPDKLAFSIKPKESKVTVDQYFRVYESADGNDWQKICDTISNNSGNDDWRTVRRTLMSTTRFIKFEFNGREAGGYFGDIQISELRLFKTEDTKFNFGKVNVDEQPTILVPFIHANAGNNVTVSSNSTLFSVSSPIPHTGRDKMGIEYCEVTFIPENASAGQIDTECSGKITFSDEKGNTHEITIKGTPTNKKVPKFTWNEANEPYYCTSSEVGAETYSIPNIVSSTNKNPLATISFESSNESIAKVISNTLYIYTKDNEERQDVTISVSQIAIDGWTEKVDSFTFKPRKRIDLHVPFMVTKELFENAYEIHSKLDYYKWDNESGVKLGGDDSNPWPWFDFPSTMYDAKYVVFEFEGTPDSLFFKYRTNNTAASEAGWIGTAPNWYVFESANDVFSENTGDAIWTAKSSASNFEENEQAAIKLSPNTHYIKLVYQGNFAGYFKDVSVTAFDGYYYVKEKRSGKYLSRGGAERNKAVVDNYGIAIRKTRSNDSNNVERGFARFQHVDNEKFVCEDNEGHLITNSANKRLFLEEKSGEEYVFSSANNPEDPVKYYLKVGDGNVLVRTTNPAEAARWTLESIEDHQEKMSALKDSMVSSATNEFNERITSLAALRARLGNNDYDRDTISDGLNLPYRPDDVQGETDNNSTVYTRTKGNLVPGLYCLNVKAYYRTGHMVRAYDSFKKGLDSPVAYVSVTDNSVGGKTATTQLVSIFDSPGDITGNPSDFQIKREDDKGELITFFYPNTTSTANAILDKPHYYDNDVYLYVHAKEDGKGEITYSIQSPSNPNDSNGLCYKNITLTRLYRKEFTFNQSGDWNDGDNWEYGGGTGVVPSSIHKVVIQASALISDGDFGAYKITLESGGAITINPNAALAVGEGGIVGATKDNLVLEANSDGQTGALRLYPGTEAPEATVELYCKAIWDSENAVWQYIGSPLTKETVNYNERLFYKCWLYKWNDNGSWTNAGNWNKMEPFRGYAFTRDGQSVTPPYVFCGTLNEPSKTDVSLALTNYATGENVFANSWMAPIDITKFEDGDFIGVSKTIYLFDMGNEGFNSESAGKGGSRYKALPIYISEFVDPQTTIPSMQGFVVQPKDGVESGAKLNLNYERLVWKSEDHANAALRAPERRDSELRAQERRDSELRASGRRDSELQSRVCVHIMSADSLADHVYLLEKEGAGFARGYDDGYDAKKMFADGLPAIYTYDTIGKLAVSATDDVLETYLGINTTASTTYTISFSHVIGEGLGLRDLVTDTCIAITDSTTYTFTASANTPNQIRFVVEEYVEPQSWNGGTSIDNVDAGDMRIWQADDLLSVTGAPRCSSVRLYNAEGKLIISEKFNGATTIQLSALPKGVYVAMVNETNVKIMR